MVVAFTLGDVLNCTCSVVVSTHPLASVPMMVYVVVCVGAAKALSPLALDAIFGVQLYVLAPEACNNTGAELLQ